MQLLLYIINIVLPMKKFYIKPEIEAFMIDFEINIMSAEAVIAPWQNDGEPIE